MLSGGLNDVALSSSSARRCDTFGDDVATHLEVLERFDFDSAVVLDLADRGTHDVVDLGRLDPAALGLGVGEHQQRLAAAAHAGGHVVELVVVRQHLGVVDLGLELVEHGELAVDQRAVAAGHRDEDVRHAAAQHLDLFVGDADERRLHRVERIGELGQLVVAAGIDRLDLWQHGLATRGSRMASTSAGSCSVATWLARFDTVFTRRVTERVSSKAIDAASSTALSAMNVRTSACFWVCWASACRRGRRSTSVMSFWRSRLWSDSATEPGEVELGAGAGFGRAAGGVELEPVLRQRGREAALAELLRPLFGGDRAELVHHRFDLGVPHLGGGERRRVGDVLVRTP